MKTQIIEPDAATSQPKLAALPSGGDGLTRKAFIDTQELLTQIPVCRRTLRNWMNSGKIPYIRMGGRIIFHRESVEAALLRAQRGGVN
jgi:excisionase family DNA binding protein